MYSYVIEVADFDSDLGLQGKALVSEILAFYHPLENALGRTGRRGHVHLGHFFDILESYLYIIVFEGFEDFYGDCHSYMKK